MSEQNFSEHYFKCGGCGRFVAYTKMQEHYESKPPHSAGIAVEEPPAPATVANPPTPPMFHGQPIPPRFPEPNQPFRVNIKLMYRDFPVAFMWWTIIVIIATALFVSTAFAWLVSHP